MFVTFHTGLQFFFYFFYFFFNFWNLLLCCAELCIHFSKQQKKVKRKNKYDKINMIIRRRKIQSCNGNNHYQIFNTNNSKKDFFFFEFLNCWLQTLPSMGLPNASTTRPRRPSPVGKSTMAPVRLTTSTSRMRCYYFFRVRVRPVGFGL